MSKASFDAVEQKLVQLVKQAGVKDAVVGEVVGQFYPRAFVWARRAEVRATKLGKTEHVVTYEVVIETLSFDSKSAYEEAKKIYFDFYNLILADMTLGGLCLRALPRGFERFELRTEDKFLVQFVTWIEVLMYD